MTNVLSLAAHLAGFWRRLVDLRRGRLAPRLIAFCLLAAVLPLASGLVVGGRAVTGVLQEQAEASLQNHASAIAGQIDAVLVDHLKDAKVLAADPAIVRFLTTPPDARTDALRDAALASLQRFLGSDPSYTIGFLLSDK